MVIIDFLNGENMKKRLLIILLLSHTLIHSEAKTAKEEWFDAVYGRDLKKIESLLAAGADINQTDKYDKTALETAVMLLANDKVVEKLLEKGADVTKKLSGGETILEAAQSAVYVADKFLEITEKGINDSTEIKSLLEEASKKEITPSATKPVIPQKTERPLVVAASQGNLKRVKED